MNKSLFDFNNDGMKGLMKTFKENYDKGYFTTQTLYGGYTNYLLTDVSSPSSVPPFTS